MPKVYFDNKVSYTLTPTRLSMASFRKYVTKSKDNRLFKIFFSDTIYLPS